MATHMECQVEIKDVNLFGSHDYWFREVWYFFPLQRTGSFANNKKFTTYLIQFYLISNNLSGKLVALRLTMIEYLIHCFKTRASIIRPGRRSHEIAIKLKLDH